MSGYKWSVACLFCVEGMSGWWRGLGRVPRGFLQGAGFLAFVVLLVVLVDSAAPFGGRLDPVLVTDRDVYTVGETIRVETSYVNPYHYVVSFSPPSSLPGVSGRYDGEASTSQSMVNISWVARSFPVEPGGSFIMFREEFAATREGSFVVRWMGLSKTVQVLRGPS